VSRTQVQSVRTEAADAFITASRALVGIAVRSINAAPVEVTLPQHRLMVLLAAHGDQTVKDLADQLDINASNASRLCDRLQKLGLLARDRSTADGRSVVVSLTDAGRGLLEAVRAQRREEVGQVLAAMSAHDVEKAIDALAAFSAAAHELGEADWASRGKDAFL